MIPTLSGAIDHVHIYVPSRRAAAAWYADTLGFSIVEEFTVWASEKSGPLTLSDPTDSIHFALFRSDKKRPVSLAFGVTYEEYVAWKTHLSTHQITVRESDHTMSYSLYFDDPYGNTLEITTYDIDHPPP